MKIRDVTHIVEPPLQQILEYCAEDPVERVFLEDVARRGLGRFSGIEDGDGSSRSATPARTSFRRVKAAARSRRSPCGRGPGC